LTHPYINLTELGQLLNPPLSKSGVNGRLRRISQIADKIRANPK
jgi:DNA-binding transcriptional regulator WhiA